MIGVKNAWLLGVEEMARYVNLLAAAPALFAGWFALVTPALALPAPPALLPNQQDGVFLTDGVTSVTFQTNTETPEFFIHLPISPSPVAPADFIAGIVRLTSGGDTQVNDDGSKDALKKSGMAGGIATET